MKKNKMKKALLALAIAPCVLLAGTGCGKDDPPSGLSVEQQNAAYTTLKTTLASNNLVNTTSNAVYIRSSFKDGFSVNWDNSGVPTAQREAVAEMLDIPVENRTEEGLNEEGIGYNSADNTGYYWEKGKAYDKDANNVQLDTKSHRIKEQEFVQKSGNDYYKYDYRYQTSYSSPQEDIKHKYKIDDKYAINTYKTDALEEVNEGLETLAEFVKDNATLNDFKQDLALLGQQMIDDNMDGSIELPSTGVSTALDITLTDGIYTLTATLNIDDFEMEGFAVDITASTSVKFDGDSIDNIDSTMKMSYGTDINCKEALGTNVSGVTFDNDDHVSATMTMEQSRSIDLNNAFDSTYVNQDVTGYTGTGEEGAVENETISIKYVFVDFEENVSCGNGARYNELMNLTNSSAYYFDSENVTKTYYWDRACTQPVEADDVAPSYDTEIYVKLTANDGYAVVYERRYMDGKKTSSPYQSVHDIASGNYELMTLASADVIDKVYINGTEVADCTNGIAFTQKGIYYVEVHVTNPNY